MRASRYVAKNAFLMTFGLFAGRLLAFFVYRELTGEAGKDGTGVWGLAVDLTTIILTISNFGLGVLITREIVKRREHTWAVLWAALRIRWALGLVSYAALVGYLLISGYDAPTRAAVLLMAVGVLLESTGMACDSVLQAHEKFEHQTISQLVSAVVYFALAWWWLAEGHGVMGVIWANVLSRIARLLVIVPLMIRNCGPWRRPRDVDRVSLRWLMGVGVPLFMATTFGIISYKVDTVMIFQMLGKTATGIYTIGHRPLDLLLMVPNIFVTALFPSLQRYRELDEAGGQGNVERMGERSLRYLHAVCFPLALFCTLAAAPLIRLTVTTTGLEPSIRVFRIVIWGLPLQAASSILNRQLMAAGRERVFMKIAVTAMLTNVLLNLVMIPWMRWLGAAMTTITSLGVSFLMHRHYLGKAGLRLPMRRALGGGTAAILASWAGAVLLGKLLFPGWGVSWIALPDSGPVPFTVMTLGTGLLYAAALWGMRVIDRDDLRLLVDMIPGRSRE